MSHPFSSTLDALQAHFSKKSAVPAPAATASPPAPAPASPSTEQSGPRDAGGAAGSTTASGGQSRTPELGAAAPGVTSAAERASMQHAPSMRSAGSLVNERPEYSYTSSWAPNIDPITAPSVRNDGSSRTDSDPWVRFLQQSASGPQTGRSPPLDHTTRPEQLISEPRNPGLLTAEVSHHYRSQNAPGADFPIARTIAPTASGFMNEPTPAVPGPSLDVASSNTPQTGPSELPGAGMQAPPMDTGTDSLLKRQIALVRQEAAAGGERGQSEEPDSDTLDDVEQQVLASLEGGPRKRVKVNTQPEKYFETGTQNSNQPSMRGRGRSVKKRGPRRAAEPTGDVKLRLNMASEAYVQGRVGDAIKLVEDAIRINAEIHRAWILLAQLFEEQGDLKKRLTALICAAQLEPKNVEGWLSVAQSAVALQEIYPDDAEDLTRQAILCYSCALRADVEHQTARHSRAALCLDRGQYKGAAKDYVFLVNRNFCDVYALRGLAETTVLLAESSKRKQTKLTPEAAIEAYRRCIAHFREHGADPDYPFEWEDVYVFVDLLGYVGQYKEAIRELKSLARWLLGRDDESFWDYDDGNDPHYDDDDREWDADDRRRIEVPDFIEGRYPDTSYGNGLPLQLRTKLGVYRLQLGQEDEAMRHFDWIDPSSGMEPELLSENAHLVVEAGSALYEKAKYALALRFYEPLWDVPDALDATSLLRAGRCYLNVGDKRQAEECFTAAIDADEMNYQPCIDARLELARMYEAAREDQEAYILVSEAMKLQEAQDEDEPQDGDLDLDAEDDDDDDADEDMDGEGFGPPDLSMDSGARAKKPPRKKPARRVARMRAEKPKRKPRPLRPAQPRVQRQRPRVFALSEDVLREENRRSEEMAIKWEIVRAARREASPDDRAPPEALMTAAGALVEDFRSYKDFYPWEKYLTHLGIEHTDRKPVMRNLNLVEMAERLSHNLGPGESGPARPTGEKYAVGYRGVPFSDWLDLFLEYAMGLAHTGKAQEAYKVCESARDAVVFSNSKEDMFLIHVAWAACALRARDEETCVAMARYFTSKHQFDTDAFRMFAALSRLCPSPASWYASGPVQKFLLRQIRIMDTTLVPKSANDGRGGGVGAGTGGESPAASGSEDGGPLPTELATYPGKELDSTLLTIYGHVLFISNSFTYALNFLLRAHSLDPDNMMIALSIAQCYIQDGLKRQSDNRQYLLAQGFAFLHRYYNARIASASASATSAAAAAAERQEAHYNLARTYHGVGLPHLAMEYYHLALLEKVEDEGEGKGKGKGKGKGVMGSQDISREAAFNLQQLCLVGGDLETVRLLGERYLVL